MSEVKRFSVGVDGEDPNGNLVRYVDYAALQQKLDAVLAENVALEQRAEAAEAQIAELEKQEPYAYAYRFKGKQGLSFRKLDIDKCDSRIMPLFTSAGCITRALLRCM